MKKKQKRIVTALIIVIAIAIALAAVVVYERSKYLELAQINNEQEIEMLNNQKQVYVVTTLDGTGIKAGEILTDGINVQRQVIYTGLNKDNYITASDLGCQAVVDMSEGIAVMTNMVAAKDIYNDTREYEIQVANLMIDQEENDFVDVRIMFPDGGDYLVLPKKQIRNLNLTNQVWWTYLNEEEMLRLASATIDAYTITGTKIYTTRYVESNLQEEAVPTYLVNATVADMMDSTSPYYDNNLLTKAQETLNIMARKNLEERLATLSEEKLTAVSDGHGLEDTARGSVLTGIGAVNASSYNATATDDSSYVSIESGDTSTNTSNTSDEDTFSGENNETTVEISAPDIAEGDQASTESATGSFSFN